MQNKNRLILVLLLYFVMNIMVFSIDIIWLCGWTEDNAYGWIKDAYKTEGYYQYKDASGVTKTVYSYEDLLLDSNGVNDITGPIVANGGKINNILDITTDATNDSLIKQGDDINSQIEQKNIKNDPKILIGHSQGGLKGFAYMNQHDKNNVKAIISVGTPWKGAHIINKTDAIAGYRDNVIAEYELTKALYDKVKDKSIMKTFGVSDPFAEIDIAGEFTGGIWDLFLNEDDGTGKTIIGLDSAQSMNPEGDYIKNTVQNIEVTHQTRLDYSAMKRFIANYSIAKYGGHTSHFFQYQSFISKCTNEELVDHFKENGFDLIYIQEDVEEWNGKKSIPDHIKIGSIIGIHSDIWTGIAQSQKAGLYERELVGTKIKYDQYGPHEIPIYESTGYVAELDYAVNGLTKLKNFSLFNRPTEKKLLSLRSSVKRLRSLIQLENIQKRYDEWVGSKEHDGLIASFSQEMTPNLGGSWIGGDEYNSNIRMDVYHISMDINDDRTKEEMQNDKVREQLTKWIAIVEEGER